MSSKISVELSRAMVRNIVSHAIVEIESGEGTGFRGLANKLGIPIETEIRFSKFNREYISVYLKRGNALELSDQDSVRGIYLNKELRQVRNVDFLRGNMLLRENGIVRNILQRSVTYDPKPGQIPTSDTKRELGGFLAQEDGFTGKGLNYAVLDTGYMTTPQNIGKPVTTYSTVLHEGGNVDTSGHGSWCNTCISGLPYSIGNGITIEGMVPDANMTSIRCLFGPMGMGMTSHTLKAMKLAIDLGIDIISMSLGSDYPTEPGDPLSTIITEATENGTMFVIAAGNAGPERKTIGSPGDVEDSITVGSMSYTDRKPSWFSSRGPTIDGRIKPDILSFGGGRQSREELPDETILSSSAGLLDLMDGKNGLASIAGTSMATPTFAGLLGWWSGYYLEKTGTKLDTYTVKKIFREVGVNCNTESGYGLAKYEWIKEYLK